MARNVEIKARIEDCGRITSTAAALASEGPFEIAQDDTFFRCDAGRLKLRMFSADSGELIFYRRENQQGPKESFYLRSRTSEPNTLRESLLLAYGQVGRVVKQRTLFLAGRTRIHIDRVEGLGHFLELEVVLTDDEPIEAGVSEAEQIMLKLGIKPSQWVDAAYVDLLAGQTGHPMLGCDSN
ncbi:adenylate cyclase [Betaproteobacteria bacterium]|nr:adenylate cyclase [Betaproteobacteria bacterium]